MPRAIGGTLVIVFVKLFGPKLTPLLELLMVATDVVFVLESR